MARRLPPLNQLRAFEAAARNLSFRKAGDELNVTHAAISHQIKALERNLGASLFHRQTRSVALTEAAEALYRDLCTALDLMDDAVSRFATRQDSAPLRLSVAPSFASHWLLKRMPEFEAGHPRARIEIDISTNVHELGDRGFDAAIRHGAGDWKRLRSERLLDEELCAFASPEVAASVTDGLMSAGPQLLTASSRAGEWQQWFASCGIEADLSARITVFQTQALALNGAITGLGFALADPRLVSDDVAAGRLVRVSDHAYRPGNGFYLVSPRSAATDERIRGFAAWLKQELAAEPQ